MQESYRRHVTDLDYHVAIYGSRATWTIVSGIPIRGDHRWQYSTTDVACR